MPLTTENKINLNLMDDPNQKKEYILRKKINMFFYFVVKKNKIAND